LARQRTTSKRRPPDHHVTCHRGSVAHPREFARARRPKAWRAGRSGPPCAVIGCADRIRKIVLGRLSRRRERSELHHHERVDWDRISRFAILDDERQSVAARLEAHRQGPPSARISEYRATEPITLVFAPAPATDRKADRSEDRADPRKPIQPRFRRCEPPHRSERARQPSRARKRRTHQPSLHSLPGPPSLTGRFRSSLGLRIAEEFDRAPDVARSLLERAYGGTIRQFEIRFRD